MEKEEPDSQCSLLLTALLQSSPEKSFQPLEQYRKVLVRQQEDAKNDWVTLSVFQARDGGGKGRRDLDMGGSRALMDRVWGQRDTFQLSTFVAQTS